MVTENDNKAVPGKLLPGNWVRVLPGNWVRVLNTWHYAPTSELVDDRVKLPLFCRLPANPHPNVADVETLSAEPARGLPDPVCPVCRDAWSYVQSLRRALELDGRHAAGHVAIDRRGANWKPPKSDARCFLARMTGGTKDGLEAPQRTEFCENCGKHIRHHFGGTHYFCDPGFATAVTEAKPEASANLCERCERPNCMAEALVAQWKACVGAGRGERKQAAILATQALNECHANAIDWKARALAAEARAEHAQETYERGFKNNEWLTDQLDAVAVALGFPAFQGDLAKDRELGRLVGELKARADQSGPSVFTTMDFVDFHDKPILTMRGPVDTVPRKDDNVTIAGVRYFVQTISWTTYAGAQHVRLIVGRL